MTDNKKYYWEANSNDGAFYAESTKLFSTIEDCYNDMRDNALEKMKWNTEYKEDFYDMAEDDYIGYDVKFYPNKIIHTSYSGEYTYEIKEKNNNILDDDVVHDPQIVNEINELYIHWGGDRVPWEFQAILYCILQREWGKYEETFGFLPADFDADSIEREHAHNIMQFLCDDNDLYYIINYVKKYEK